MSRRVVSANVLVSILAPLTGAGPSASAGQSWGLPGPFTWVESFLGFLVDGKGWRVIRKGRGKNAAATEPT